MPDLTDGLPVPPPPEHTGPETPAGHRSGTARATPLAPPGHPDPDRRITDSQLAVLLRQVQWALDDAAYEWPRGRVTPQRREHLAGTLEHLAAIVRTSVPEAEGGGR